MITGKDVEYIAKLARLTVEEDEQEHFAAQLSSILEYIEQLNQAATDDVPPTAFVSPEHSPMREDSEQPSLSREDALRNAPLQKQGHFAVPKVISH
ncbi:MAG: Asp-tRNA(Asn)/Glu-tRNA(Gln) amidotransferase subunit GatC [Chitinivibrionales bacterium]|nr:Asp-tRNA(Asn)/Glu-tRNA(Gln) amidotransferase subunit GatC [Chitinivibrionales bacterium]